MGGGQAEKRCGDVKMTRFLYGMSIMVHGGAGGGTEGN